MDHPSSDHLFLELEAMFQTIQERWHLDVVLKSYDPLWLQPSSAGSDGPARNRNRHRHPRCLAAKRVDLGVACAAECLTGLPALCGGRSAPFRRRCHAAVEEFLIPIRLGGEIAAVISLGPIATDGDERAEGQRAAAILLQGYACHWQTRCRQVREAAQSDLLSRVLAAIDDHLSTGARLEDVARRLHCSPSWLSRQVQSRCGCHYSELRDRRRLQLACDRLRDTDHSIDAIAQACGFPHPTYFYTVFKRRFGCTPGTWRRRRPLDP